jgi:integrase/recombinase XerD
MRVGEVAALRVGAVIDQDGGVKQEIALRAEHSKGSRARVVFLGEKLHRELTGYVGSLPSADPQSRFLTSQKREGFSPNTLAQTLNTLYQRAGLDGPISHSGRRTLITTLASKGVGGACWRASLAIAASPPRSAILM